MTLHKVVFLLGSNLGDRAASLFAARERISTLIGSITLASREYTTKPQGNFVIDNCVEEQPPFLNQALAVTTILKPEIVMNAIGRIERELGRTEHASEYTTSGNRLYHNRIIDIDILFYDDAIIDTKRLIVPHPRLAERLFALEPVTEIMPEYSHPILKISMKELFNSLLLGDSQ